jgi:hypothetical protein
MTTLGIKAPDRADSNVVLMLHIDRAGNWEEVNLHSGEAGLHAATLGSRHSNGYSALEGNCGTMAGKS